jgi:hypothetical protein
MSIALRSFLLTFLSVAMVPVYGENTPLAESRSPDMVGLFSQADDHWAFQAPRQGRLSPEDGQPWARTAIDRLISRRLGEHGLGPAPSAGKRTLLRRLYYDLVGLSPSAQEVQRFQEDQSPEAYERVVDRLLASGQYGEKWGRHWLDVARYGDTKGYVFEAAREYSHAYRYRDWVVDALNGDMPYDRFVRLQLAADLMESSAQSEDLAAVGFLTLGRRFITNKHDIIDDRIDVTFRGMMGLTVSCARCHDHVYDPVSIEDYYALYGVFLNSPEHEQEGLPPQLGELQSPKDGHVLVRGNPDVKGKPVPRRFLSYFSQGSPLFVKGSGRRELAERIAGAENPLTARVLVNRVWSHLFGKPLVSTPSDFGLRSDQPVHHDVLDHLAATFIEKDHWSIKRLIRRIVISSVYRQSSTVSNRAAEMDPDNQLLSHSRRRRLDFEALRDSLLLVSGDLDFTMGGASVRIEKWPPSNRRTLYAFIDRQNLPAIFRTFDFASPDTHAPQRSHTTVPQQALYLLNSQFAQDVADRVAKRTSAIEETTARMRQLYRLVLARNPEQEELELGGRYLTAAQVNRKADKNLAIAKPLDPWARFAHTLLMSNEFAFLD